MKIAQGIFTVAYLTFKVTAWGVGFFIQGLTSHATYTEAEPEIEAAQPLPDLKVLAKVDELEALEGLIQTLRAQEQALLDEALRNRIKKPAKAAKLEAQAAKVHLQMIQKSNKAVKIREELDL